VGVESQKTVASALSYTKTVLGINPDIVVHDLSPNIFSAVSKIYGSEKSAVDPFHVMQDLNRAIRKDLSRFQNRRFGKELKEFKELRNYINNFQKKYPISKNFTQILQKLPPCEINHTNSVQCRIITQKILEFLCIQDRQQFFQEILKYIRYLKNEDIFEISTFAINIEEKIPKRVTTEKAYNRTVKEVLKKLKTLYLSFRKPIEKEKKRFNKKRWAIFYQPEKLTIERAQLLTKLLNTYPELDSYRDLTLTIGSIYRLPQKMIHENLINDLIPHPNWGPELHACISTFKRQSAAIFRFRDFFEKNPDLPKRCRSNMEYKNVGIKQIFRSGKYLKRMARIENELKLHLGGQVRNLINV
jgi:hypothetical protein